MRISDWSSEVCSSDHATGPVTGPGKETVYSAAAPGYSPPVQSHSVNPAGYELAHTTAAHQVQAPHPLRHRRGAQYPSTAELRVGNECVSPRRARWTPSH